MQQCDVRGVFERDLPEKPAGAREPVSTIDCKGSNMLSVSIRAIFIRTTYLRGTISGASVPITADWQSCEAGDAVLKTSG
jgi:hypothetical protein